MQNYFLGNTYEVDKSLFKDIGFEEFHNVVCWEEYYVGRFELEDDSYIMLWVTPTPAQFWKAEIYDKSKKRKTIIETGSGSLTKYWDTFLGIAKGMIVIISIE